MNNQSQTETTDQIELDEEPNHTLNAQKLAASIEAFELQLWRLFHGFLRWQEDCEQYMCDKKITSYQLALLQVLKIKDRPKTIYDISRLLNRDDPNNIQYALGNLVKLGLVEKLKLKNPDRTLSYQITEKGATNVACYAAARKKILQHLFESLDLDKTDLDITQKMLQKFTSIYDEATRLTTC